MKHISTEQWMTWIGATLMAAITMVGFIYTNFESKADYKDWKDDLEKRLERIERKVDTLLERSK